MCIPCVMCGACFAEAGTGSPAGLCPECGRPVPAGALSCPACYTFIPRAPQGGAPRAEPGTQAETFAPAYADGAAGGSQPALP